MSNQPRTLTEITDKVINQHVKDSRQLKDLSIPKSLVNRLEETHMRDNCPLKTCNVCRSARPISEAQEKEKKRREKYKGRQVWRE